MEEITKNLETPFQSPNSDKNASSRQMIQASRRNGHVVETENGIWGLTVKGHTENQ